MSAENTKSAHSETDARSIINHMWETMTLDLGTDDAGVSHRYPRNLEEIRSLKKDLAAVEAMGVNDSAITQDCLQYKELLENATKRTFQGSYKFLIFAVFAVLAMALFTAPISPSPITSDNAQVRLESEIANEAKVLESRIASVQTAPGAEEKTRREALVKESQDNLAHLKSLTPAQHMEEYNNNIPSGTWNLIRILLFLLIPALYYVSAKAPGYLTVRRQSMLRKWRTASGFLGKMVAVIIGAVMAVPVTTTITHWSNGTTTKSDDALENGVIKLAFIGIVVVVFVVTVVYVMPAMTLGNFIMNYGPDVMDKIKNRSTEKSSEVLSA